MTCLVAGLLCMGTVGLFLTAMILSGTQSWGALVPGLLGAVFLGLGIRLFRRHRDDLSEPSVVFLAIALFVGTAVVFGVIVPAFLAYRIDARRGSCVNNLRLIDHAKQALAERNNWTNGQIIADTPEAIWAQIASGFDGTNRLSCPEAKGTPHYIYGPVGVPPRCPVADKYPEHVYTLD